MKIPEHPDTISNLAPDCRRVLREDYLVIQATAGAGINCSAWARVNLGESHEQYLQRCAAAKRAKEKAIADAVAEYKRTAALWGIVV